jgi:hypothetical protein
MLAPPATATRVVQRKVPLGFMIVSSLRQIAPKTAHDHGLGEARWPGRREREK